MQLTFFEAFSGLASRPLTRKDGLANFSSSICFSRASLTGTLCPNLFVLLFTFPMVVYTLTQSQTKIPATNIIQKIDIKKVNIQILDQ